MLPGTWQSPLAAPPKACAEPRPLPASLTDSLAAFRSSPREQPDKHSLSPFQFSCTHPKESLQGRGPAKLTMSTPQLIAASGDGPRDIGPSAICTEMTGTRRFLTSLVVISDPEYAVDPVWDRSYERQGLTSHCRRGGPCACGLCCLGHSKSMCSPHRGSSIMRLSRHDIPTTTSIRNRARYLICCIHFASHAQLHALRGLDMKHIIKNFIPYQLHDFCLT
jgi:hypothetical protein